MQALFEVLANGSDITPLLKDRLVSVQITDKTGLTNDTCTIRVDDRDGKVAIPPRGATLRIALGWPGQGLCYLGTYKIDEVALESSPMTLTISGKGADMRESAKNQRKLAYENTTLAAIVAEVAQRHQWTPVCQIQAAIARADQLNESDLNFITRLARMHGATATVKDGKLLVLPRGAGRSASGAVLDPVMLEPGMLSHYSFRFADRARTDGVQALVHDPKTGRQSSVLAGAAADGDSVQTDRRVYPDAATAKAAAAATLEAFARNTASGTLSMPGRADICADRQLLLSNFKHGVDGEYLVESVAHTYDGKAWRTEVQINGGNAGKSKAGQGRKGKDGKALVAPPATH
jgi:phage protein D